MQRYISPAALCVAIITIESRDRSTGRRCGLNHARSLGNTAAIHDTGDVRRRLARLVSCNMSAYSPQTKGAACRRQGSRELSLASLVAGYAVRVLPDQGGCRFDGEEKEGCTVIGRHNGSGGHDRRMDNVELLAAAGEEGCAYAVLVRGRGTDGRDVTGSRWCLYTRAALGQPAGRSWDGQAWDE
jgi:hypothetical protein